MNLKSASTTVDGITFETTQFPAMKALELMGRLTKVLGPTLGALASADPEAEMDSFGPVLAMALKDLDPKELSAIAVELLQGTTALVQSATGQTLVQLGSRENLDLVFSSRLSALFKVAVHAIKLNYGDFIGGSGLGAPRRQEPSAS